MGKLNLEPNLRAARAFLDALEPDGTFSFQTFPEGPGTGKSYSPIVLHGRMDDVASRLTALNNAGHGIFVMLNKGGLPVEVHVAEAGHD